MESVAKPRDSATETREVPVRPEVAASRRVRTVQALQHAALHRTRQKVSRNSSPRTPSKYATQPVKQPPIRRRARNTSGLRASNACSRDDPSNSSPEQTRPESVHSEEWPPLTQDDPVARLTTVETERLSVSLLGDVRSRTGAMHISLFPFSSLSDVTSPLLFCIYIPHSPVFTALKSSATNAYPG